MRMCCKYYLFIVILLFAGTGGDESVSLIPESFFLYSPSPAMAGQGGNTPVGGIDSRHASGVQPSSVTYMSLTIASTPGGPRHGPVQSDALRSCSLGVQMASQVHPGQVSPR